MSASVRALVACEDPDQRARLAAALADAPEGAVPLAVETAERASAEDVTDVAVVVLDADGAGAVASLRAGRSDLALLVITAPGDAEAACRALEDGADDAVPADAVGGQALARRAAVALDARSRRATAAFEKAIDALFILDDDRRVVSVNRSGAELLGLPERELVGRCAADFMGAADYREILPVWARAVEHGIPEERTFIVHRADATTIPVEATVSPSVSPGRHLVIVRDLSERLRAEAEAERARQELQAVIDGVPSFVFIKDRELRYRLVNALMERHLGLEPGAQIGRTDEAIIAPEDVATVRANDLHVLETGETVVVEEHIGPPDERRTLLTQKFPLRDDEGQIVGVCGVATDITERERLLASVRRSAERHATVAALGRGALAGAPLAQLLDEAAQRAAEIVGTGISEIVEVTGGLESDLAIRAAVGWEGSAASFETLPGGRRSLGGYVVQCARPVTVNDVRTETRFEATPLLDDHDIVSGMGVPILGESGPWGAICVLSRTPRSFDEEDTAFLQAVANVLAAAIARDQAVELRRRLEQSQRLESLGQLAGGIAHDFNNLLAVILSHADFALEDLPDDHPVRDDVANVRMAAQRAAVLTRRLLTLGRPALSGEGAVDAARIVRDMEGLLRRTIGAHIEMIVDPASEPLMCRAGAGQIEQIVLNLATNARDAMPTGGRLILRADAVALEDGFPVAGRPLPAGPYARISVSDTGPGMGPDVAARAFDPFFTTKQDGTGTGLGLSTVHGIAAQLAGGASIASQPGAGTEVSVYLPLTEAPETIAPVGGGTPEARVGHGERVLVVEDEEGVRRLVSRVLRRAGYEVIEARDGAAGLRAAASGEPPIDLLLTDVVMPQVSGPQLAEQVRRMNPDAAVLFMSGYTPRMLAAQMRGDARAPVLQKPFTASDLLDAVAEQLGRRVS